MPQQRAHDIRSYFAGAIRAWARLKEVGPVRTWTAEHIAQEIEYVIDDDADVVATEIESAVAQAREEEREACAKIAEDAYPCSCDEAYTSRKLTAPDCFHCVPLADAAAEIRARKDKP